MKLDYIYVEKPELYYISLGKNVRKHRALAGMTQKQLSEAVGCSVRHIGQIESAKNIPCLAVTSAIANTLNVGIDKLINGDLHNQADFFIKELASLTDGFESRGKLMSIEIMKAILAVVKEYKSSRGGDNYVRRLRGELLTERRLQL